MGIREPHTHTHGHARISNSHLDLCDSNLKGIYDKGNCVGGEADILFWEFGFFLHINAVKVPDIRHTCYNKQPALHR